MIPGLGGGTAKKVKKEKKVVPSWHSELRIWHCHYSGSGHSCGTGLIPGPGMAHAVGAAKKEEEEGGGEEGEERLRREASAAGTHGQRERCVRVEVEPSHVRADGPIRKLDFYSAHIVKPLGNLKQESDII